MRICGRESKINCELMGIGAILTSTGESVALMIVFSSTGMPVVISVSPDR